MGGARRAWSACARTPSSSCTWCSTATCAYRPATLRLRREPLRSGFEPQVQPLVLSSLGRSGSTWLMKMFAAHPEIVMMRRFPYESSAGEVLDARDEGAVRPRQPGAVRASGHLPFRPLVGGQQPLLRRAGDRRSRAGARGWAREHVERLARFFQETVEQWYLTVARSQGQEAPRYFAEKHLWPNFLPMLIRELYPGAREVFLVRDFRDVACSALAADARRGYAGFGREPDMSEEQYVRDVVRRMATDLHRSWEARGAGAHLVRYEDMARRPQETLAVAAHLPGRGRRRRDGRPRAGAGVRGRAGPAGLDLGSRARRSRTATRAHPEQSIGRWRERTRNFARSSTRRSARR